MSAGIDFGWILNTIQQNAACIEESTLVPTVVPEGDWDAENPRFRFRFSLFCHPYACAFLETVRRHGLDGLLKVMRVPDEALTAEERSLHVQMAHSTREAWEAEYGPDPLTVLAPWPVDCIEFDIAAAYGQYNWEVFFHIPTLIAGRLSARGQYAEAMEWYRTIFDPTERPDSARVPSFSDLPDGYDQWWTAAWKFRPFLEFASSSWGIGGDFSGFDETPVEFSPGQRDWNAAVRLWRESPFDPHSVARARLVGYQRFVLMKYLDNLIAWGDSEFRRDTLEGIQEANQLYLHALDLLGARPVIPNVRPKASTKTFGELLAAPGIDPLHNVAVQMETLIGARVLEGWRAGAQGPSFAAMWLFCTPPNQRLLTYWDTVEDRLFKIRNSLNIDGVFRVLALFAPPIDPAALVAAAAAGIPIGDAVSGLTSPPPQHRFLELHRRALELTSEVRSLGQSLLSVLEKKDAEALSLLRQDHERRIQDLVIDVRKLQVADATEQQKAAQQAIESAVMRRDHYGALIDEGLLPLEGMSMALLRAGSGASVAAGILGVVSAALISTGEQFMPSLGSRPIGEGIAVGISIAQVSQTSLSAESQLASTGAGYARRKQEWTFARDQAQRDITQAETAKRSADIRVEIAGKELDNQRLQASQSNEILEFLKTKYTSVQLYTWLSTELRKLHRKALDLALEVARKAQAAYRFELSDPGANFLAPTYTPGAWGHLIAAEKLLHDLHRMSTTYVERHGREIELIKQVSLAEIDPIALMMLRQTGTCYFDVPEAVFDMDAPGTYDRRVHMVDVTVQCTRDVRTAIPMMVSMTSSRIRKSASVVVDYIEAEGGDDRFVRGPRSPMSIWLSHGRNDTGTFDGRDDLRYMPFENEGVVSSWALTMPSEVRPFDYGTLSDVVLTFRYKAKDGGLALRQAVQASQVDRMGDAARALQAIGRVAWITASQEVPEAWQTWVDGSDTTRTLAFTPTRAMLPEWMAQTGVDTPTVEQVLVVALASSGTGSTVALTVNSELRTASPVSALAESSLASPAGGTLLARIVPTAPTTFEGAWELTFTNVTMTSTTEVILIFLFDAET